MEVESWLTQLKTDEPQLSDFITKLESYISDNGFNGAEFERKVNIGILQASKEIDNLFNTTRSLSDLKFPQKFLP